MTIRNDMKSFFHKYKYLIIVSFILGAILVIIYNDIIFSDKVFVQRDIARYYYPLRNFATETIREGKIPLWNPYMFCGTPLHAAIQNSVFYPLSLIYYSMGVAKGLSIFILVHIFLCGIFTYLFARYFKVSWQGSLLAGLCFMFSGYTIGTICLVPALTSVTWFPLFLIVFFESLKKKDYKFSVLSGIILSIMLLGGDPAVVAATFAIVFFVSVYFFLEKLIKEKRFDSFIIYNIIIISFLFLLLTAFQTIPAVEYYARTNRSSMIWEEASMWSFPYSHLVSFVIPYFNETSFFYKSFWAGQKWLDNYYVGIITIILMLFALRYGIKRRSVRFLLLIMVLSMAICFGRYFILYPLLYKIIPAIKMFRYPVRFFFIFTFSVSILAGMGFDYMKGLLNAEKMKRLAKVFLAVGFLAMILALLIQIFNEKIALIALERAKEVMSDEKTFGVRHLPNLIYANIFNFRRTLLYLGRFGLFVFLWSITRYKKIMPWVIIVLAGLDILYTNTGFEHVEKFSYLTEPTKNIRSISKDKTLFRVFASPYAYDRFTWIRGSWHDGITISKDLFVTNRMMEFGIQDMWGYDSAQLQRSLDLGKIIYHSTKPDDTKLLNMLNVKYIASHSNIKSPNFKKISETERGAIYLNINWLPRAYMVEKIKVLDDDKAVLEYMSSKEFDPKKEVVLTKNVPGFLSKEKNQDILTATDKTVNITDYGSQSVFMETKSEKPGILFLSDTYYPGWKAYIDGKEEEIYRANYFVRAVRIPRGKHTVKFIYDPFSFKIGSFITILAILGIILYFLFRHIGISMRLTM